MKLEYRDSALKYALDVNLCNFESIEIRTDDIDMKITDIENYGKGYLNQWGYLNMRNDGFYCTVSHKNASVEVEDDCVLIVTKNTSIVFNFKNKNKSDIKNRFIDDFYWYINN